MKSTVQASAWGITMQLAPFPNILAFVEGSMERLFLNNNFNYVRVVTLYNGSGWSLDAMCKQIVSGYKVANIQPDRLVVWFDKERMPHLQTDIVTRLKRELIEAGAVPKSIAILVPDMMTENIILADEKIISESFKIDEYCYAGDGINGKSKLKSLYSDSGGNYKETFHGVQLLKKCRLGRAAQKSKIVEAFLADLNYDCWWV